jgi:hypothetical protein
MEIEFGTGKSSLTGIMAGGKCIRQTFTAPKRDLVSVSVMLSTRGRKVHGIVRLELRDFLTRKKMASFCCDAAKVVDNAWQKFPLAAELVVLSRRYELVLGALDSCTGLFITAHCADRAHSGHLFVGARLKGATELKCRFEYAEGSGA